MSWWNPFSWLRGSSTVVDYRPAARALAVNELEAAIEIKSACARLVATCAERDMLKKELGRCWRRRVNNKQRSRNLGYVQVPKSLKLEPGWELEHVPWEEACFPETSLPLYVCRVCGAAWLSSYLAKGCHSTSWPCQEEGCRQRARRPYTACETCRDKKAAERYNAKEKKKWDREGFVYSETLDRFFTESELYDYLGDDADEDGQLLPCKDLHLYLCEQEKPSQFSFHEWCEDRIGEGDWNEDRFRDECQESEELLALERRVNEFMADNLRAFFGWVPDFASPVLLDAGGLPA